MKISAELLEFCGLPSKLAKSVCENKLSDDFKKILLDTLEDNFIILLGQRDRNKEFFIGKLIEFYLLQGKKCLFKDIVSLSDDYWQSNPLFLRADVVVIHSIQDSVDNTSGLLKSIPMLYKSKKILYDITSDSTQVYKMLTDTFLPSLYTTITL